MESLDANAEIVPVRDRVQLSEEMFRTAVGGKFPDAQISAAMELLNSNDGMFPAGRGVRRIPPDLVAAVQRERLIAAMLKMVSEAGYDNVTVSGLSKCAGVAPVTLYLFFEGKEGCFLAALDAVAAHLSERLETAALRGGENWRDRLQAALEELLRFATFEVDAARTLIVGGRAGHRGSRRQYELLNQFASFLDALVKEDLDDPPPPFVAVAVVGAFEALLSRPLEEGDTNDLASLLPRLMYVAVLAYEGSEAASSELPAVRNPNQRKERR
jgi:AcrR family transcriptional regulator